MPSYESLQQQVFALEAGWRLFDRRFLGAPMWKLLRIHVQRGLAEATGLLSTDAVQQRKVRNACHLRCTDIVTFLSRIVFRRCDVVVIPAETRFRVGNRFSDPITTPLLAELDPGSTAVLELSPNWIDGALNENGHKRVLNGGVIRLVSGFLQQAIWRFHCISVKLKCGKSARYDFDRLNSELTDRLSSIAEPLRKVPGYVVSQALDYAANRLLFLVVFWFLRPRIIVLTVSYGKEALIDAAHKVGARVVEIQHGVVAPYHMGYTFPFAQFELAPQQKVSGLPDLLLLSGPAWTEGVAFHPNTKIAIYGSDLLEKCKNIKMGDSERVLIVSSQPLVGDVLIQIMDAIAKQFHHKKVTVRVHPNQSIDYMSAALALGLENVDIDAGERPIWEALLESKYVVTGPSTVLFQAIALGCATIVVRSALDSWLEPFLHGAGVTFLNGPTDVARAIQSARRTSNGERFFSARTRSLLETILQELDLAKLNVRRLAPAP